MKTIDEKLAVMRGWLEGKAIQYQTPGGAWITVDNPVWEWAGGVDYRIKPEPAPKRRVPLGPDDLPAVCWIKCNSLLPYQGMHCLVTKVHPEYFVADGVRFNWSADQLTLSWSPDRKNWKPMWKEVE